jgi:hypothetical protein
VKNLLSANIPLAIVIFAMAAAVALRAVARRPGPRGVLGAEPPPVTAVTEDSQAQHSPPAEQMQHVFHELHAEGHHGLCEVCANQYRY